MFSFDLSWLSPLLIFLGVVLFISRQDTVAGRIGRVLIGLGPITLALQLIVGATRPLTESPAVRTLLVALPDEVLLDAHPPIATRAAVGRRGEPLVGPADPC